MVVPSIKKALELGNKARHLIEQRLKSRRAAKAAAAASDAPSTSSTARTQELNRPSVAAARNYPPDASGNSDQLSPSIPVAGQSTDNGGPAAAKLVARTGALEFGIFGPRTIIGRSRNSADELDIDLKKLANSSERVARRHAEIIKRGPDYFIRDLGSIGGTYIAGRGRLGRDQLYKLKDRDQVVLGGAILQFRRG